MVAEIRNILRDDNPSQTLRTRHSQPVLTCRLPLCRGKLMPAVRLPADCGVPHKVHQKRTAKNSKAYQKDVDITPQEW
jgi:hypothetical protein